MATWEYRCQSCGGVHEVSVRPAGAMLLRCTATHEWAWHDEGAFLSAAVPVRADGAGARLAGAKARSSRASSERGRAAAKKRTASRARGAVSARKRPSREAARASSKRKKGRR